MNDDSDCLPPGAYICQFCGPDSVTITFAGAGGVEHVERRDWPSMTLREEIVREPTPDGPITHRRTRYGCDGERIDDPTPWASDISGP